MAATVVKEPHDSVFVTGVLKFHNFAASSTLSMNFWLIQYPSLSAPYFLASSSSQHLVEAWQLFHHCRVVVANELLKELLT